MLDPHRPRRAAIAVSTALLVLMIVPAAAGKGRKLKEVDVASDDFGGPIRQVCFDGGFSANGRWAVGTVEAEVAEFETRDQIVRLDVRKNRLLRITNRVDDGGPSTGHSFLPAISADGRLIAYSSRATDVATDGTIDDNDAYDVFLHDVKAGTTRVLSKVAGTNRTADGHSGPPQFSPDGRFVVFGSSAMDLVTEGPSPRSEDRTGHIFRHELTSGRTTLVSVGTDGTGGANDDSSLTAHSNQPRVFSADGRFLVFHSEASDLVEGSDDIEGGYRDVFVHDFERGTNEIVSVTNEGSAFGTDVLYQPHSMGISADGRYVFFTGRSTEVTDHLSPSSSDVFVRDRASGETRRVTNGETGGPANGSSVWQSMTPDGRWAVFTSNATDLGFDLPSGGRRNVFLYDVEGDRISLIGHRHRDPTTGSDLGDYDASISDNGRYVAFASPATDLVKQEKIGYGAEIYLYDVKKRRARRVTKFGKQIGPDFESDVTRTVLGPKGRRLLFNFARYSRVDDDFSEVERVLLLRAR